jgi:hypothetical protein
MRIEDLKAVRDWAGERLGSGNETPWDWYQLMKLREALDALIDSAEAPIRRQTEASPQSPQRAGQRLRLVDDNDPPESAPRYR